MLLFIGLGRTDRGDTLHCAGCGALIARADDICRVMDRPPRKTYTNPHGLLCPILTLAGQIEATGDAKSVEARELQAQHDQIKQLIWQHGAKLRLYSNAEDRIASIVEQMRGNLAEEPAESRE